MKFNCKHGLLKTAGFLLIASIMFGLAPDSMAADSQGDKNAKDTTSKEADKSSQAPGKDYGDNTLISVSGTPAQSTTEAGGNPAWAAQLRTLFVQQNGGGQ